ncbi:hypothetical protein DEO72_LG4g638 [Vigna unguiculata]|uniref:Uncharacterized protein n=1 Tax=Vigna unguiculata TaxID=3917 RepID=A0A4D6LLN0_VIGUN|nr:hypothetical protein DEO72_LG4g638 [Vigna unguiculata]
MFVVCGISCMSGGFGTIAAAGDTVAIPVNLAQASQSRLGETNRDSPKPVCAKGRPGDPLKFLSEQTSRLGERGLA